MTSRRQLRKFKIRAGQKAKVPPSAGQNRTMVTAREVFQVGSTNLVCVLIVQQVVPPHHVCSFVSFLGETGKDKCD